MADASPSGSGIQDPPSSIHDPRSAAPPLLLGSHLDTVIDAGKYDGALGVLIVIAANQPAVLLHKLILACVVLLRCLFGL